MLAHKVYRFSVKQTDGRWSANDGIDLIDSTSQEINCLIIEWKISRHSFVQLPSNYTRTTIFVRNNIVYCSIPPSIHPLS